MSSHLAFNRIIQQDFGQLTSGEFASLYTLTNANGMQVKITNYGAIIVSIFTPDKTQRLTDIVLGYDNVADYEADNYYLGAVIGRYAGRIHQGKISINGQQHQLTLNAPDSQLHGGKQGLNKQLWRAKTSENADTACLTLSYTSPDGEQGFPGTVNFTVNYHLNDNNELIVEYLAKTDQPTLVNLTQHSYFNLAGHNSGNVHSHQVAINADYFLPMNERAYPTGEIAQVDHTPHDFRQLKALAQDIDADNKQIAIGKGYDNYWLLNDNAISVQAFAAQVVEPNSGRRMTIYTDQPSMVLYTANYIDGSHIGKNNYCYQRRAALCLEPQRANNKEKGVTLDNTLLTPTQPFASTTRYVFDLIES
ncbi:aldose 1-epimerase [Thalassotalea insulae]|uniref:Aldose 1-epimerase n=1 Tax=Thalassotalea insulae TaxID=2056778 RepID=A0ABQ6GRK5_9GAMM|nr:aldose epimerase family protein [Thalassotalea insulae]GLX77814.1 aldose 1-epimerase [Thalassotalea insulae]